MEKVFNIVPASSGAFMFLWIFGVVMGIVIIGLIVIFALFGYQARHTSFTLTDRGLHIGPGFYSRTIPREKIEAEGVRAIDLNVEKAYQPKWKTNGSNLPGFYSGWFKLQNNEKALVFLTDRSSVVYVPTTDNYSVLMSVRDAGDMVEAIRQWEKY